MKSYYSIISIVTKPQLDEKFNIGLLCVHQNEIYFHFSETKFKLIAKLLPDASAKLTLNALRGVKKQLTQKKGDQGLFINDQLESITSIGYLNYLHRYANNVLQFSSPVGIEMKIDQPVFEVLFKKYIFEHEVFEIIQQPKTISFTQIRNQFKRKAKSFANVNFNVNETIIKDLIIPVTVDVFGKNGAFVTGQSFDFMKSAEKLQSEITSYLYLIEHTEKADHHAKCFVLGDEPSKREKQNHSFWTSLKKANSVEMVPLNESDRIIEFMQEKGVEPVV